MMQLFRQPFQDGNIPIFRLLTLGFFLWSFFTSMASAAPASILFKRACPSIENLTARLVNKGMNDNTVFYTNPVKSDQAVAFTTLLSPSGNSFDQVWDKAAVNGLMTECVTGTPKAEIGIEGGKLFLRLSTALAKAAIGKAYVLIPKDRDPMAGDSIWAIYELPYLMRNTAVTEILRVDPDNIDDLGITFWKAGDPISLGIRDPQEALRKL